MSDLITHINQARHNEACALLLLSNQTPSYRDWAITAAFYAAVHLAEAAFATRNDIQHGEYAPDRKGREVHSYRKDKIREIALSAFAPYSELYTASRNVRYLTNTTRQGIDFYTQSQAKRMVTELLPEVRASLESAIGIGLS